MKLKIRLKKNEIFALIFVILVQIFYMLQGTKVYNSYFSLFLVVAIIASSFFLVSKRITLYNKNKFILIIFILMVMLAFYMNRDTRLPIAMLALLVGMFVDENRMVSWLFWIRFFLLSVVILIAGYHHKNTLAMHGGITLLLYAMYAQQKGVKDFKQIMLLAYVILVIYTKSGSMAICGGIGVLLFLLENKKGIRKILLSKIVCAIYPVLLFCNIFSAMLVNQSDLSRWGIDISVPIILRKLVAWLDVFTSFRLSLAQYSLQKFGISLLGNNVDFNKLQLNDGGYFSLDSGLMWLIQQWGIIMTVIFCVLTIVYIRYLQRMEKYSFLILTVVIAVWSLNEDILVSAGINIAFFFMGKSLLQIRGSDVKNGNT